jgi:hypothetical protein
MLYLVKDNTSEAAIGISVKHDETNEPGRYKQIAHNIVLSQALLWLLEKQYPPPDSLS